MPHSHGETYGDYYDEMDDRRSRSPNKLNRFFHALNDGQLHEAKTIAKSSVSRPEKSREVVTYDYYDNHDQPTHQHHEYFEYDKKHGNHRYYREEDHHLPRGRSLHSEDRYYNRRRDSSHERRHKRATSHENRITEAATAALAAGLTEAVRSRHSRDQSKRAITAAIGAAAVDTFVSNGRDRNKGRHIAESAASGLLIDHLANGRSRR